MLKPDRSANVPSAGETTPEVARQIVEDPWRTKVETPDLPFPIKVRASARLIDGRTGVPGDGSATLMPTSNLVDRGLGVSNPVLGVGFGFQFSFLPGLSVLDGLSAPGTQTEQVSILQVAAPFKFLPTDPDNWTDILYNRGFELSANDTAIIRTRIVVVAARRRGRRVSMKRAATAAPPPPTIRWATPARCAVC